MKLLVASNNKHKLREIKEILNASTSKQVELVAPDQVISCNIEVEESGSTLEENAYLKALAFYVVTKIPAVADDTGLEIDALAGLPGVHSARFAGDNASDSANRQKVLGLMTEFPYNQRTARFRTVICLYDGIDPIFVEGKCEGRIAFRELGSEGFGYDSIFIPEGYCRSFSEMTADEKHSISHRGRAIRNLLDLITNGTFYKLSF